MSSRRAPAAPRLRPAPRWHRARPRARPGSAPRRAAQRSSGRARGTGFQPAQDRAGGVHRPRREAEPPGEAGGLPTSAPAGFTLQRPTRPGPAPTRSTRAGCGRAGARVPSGPAQAPCPAASTTASARIAGQYTSLLHGGADQSFDPPRPVSRGGELCTSNERARSSSCARRTTAPAAGAAVAQHWRSRRSCRLQLPCSSRNWRLRRRCVRPVRCALRLPDAQPRRLDRGRRPTSQSGRGESRCGTRRRASAAPGTRADLAGDLAHLALLGPENHAVAGIRRSSPDLTSISWPLRGRPPGRALPCTGPHSSNSCARAFGVRYHCGQ